MSAPTNVESHAPTHRQNVLLGICISVGLLVLVGIMLLIACFCRRRRRVSQRHHDESRSSSGVSHYKAEYNDYQQVQHQSFGRLGRWYHALFNKTTPEYDDVLPQPEWNNDRKVPMVTCTSKGSVQHTPLLSTPTNVYRPVEQCYDNNAPGVLRNLGYSTYPDAPGAQGPGIEPVQSKHSIINKNSSDSSPPTFPTPRVLDDQNLALPQTSQNPNSSSQPGQVDTNPPHEWTNVADCIITIIDDLTSSQVSSHIDNRNHESSKKGQAIINAFEILPQAPSPYVPTQTRLSSNSAHLKLSGRISRPVSTAFPTDACV